jgi:hypothetical protein
MNLSKKLLAYGVGAALLALSAYAAYLHQQVAKRDALASLQVAEQARQLGGLQVQLDSARKISDGLSADNAAFLARLQATSARVTPAVHAATTASVADTVLLGPAEKRFVIAPDLKTLQRRQSFHLDVLVVRNADGKIDIGRVSLAELDPDTKLPLKSEFALESVVQVEDRALNQRVGVPVLHPRLIAGIDAHGFPLVGAEVVNLERFGGYLAHVNLSVFGAWDAGNKKALGGAALQWRLFNSNISLGPAFLYPSKQISAVATVELTR